MRPGDVHITNNPWVGTGHLNDISIVRPIFHGGRIAAFAATNSHIPGIGGGIRSTEARALFAEGFHIPPMLLMRDGAVDRTLLRLLRASVPTPDTTEGDVWAQIGAASLIDDRVRRTIEDHRLDGLAAGADEIFDRSEAEMRRRTAVPEGRWRYGVQTGGLEAPFTFAVAITIAGGEAHVDFAGASPQQPRAVNRMPACTKAMSAFTLKALLLPGVPNNEGIFRLLHVHAPEGSLLNPRWPAAVGGRAATGRPWRP